MLYNYVVKYMRKIEKKFARNKKSDYFSQLKQNILLTKKNIKSW